MFAMKNIISKKALTFAIAQFKQCYKTHPNINIQRFLARYKRQNIQLCLMKTNLPNAIKKKQQFDSITNRPRLAGNKKKKF